jgi:hypothetical protein
LKTTFSTKTTKSLTVDTIHWGFRLLDNWVLYKIKLKKHLKIKYQDVFLALKWFKLFSIGYKMVFLSHILPFYYSVALLCSAKKSKSRTKNPIFRFNQKSLNHFINYLDYKIESQQILKSKTRISLFLLHYQWLKKVKKIKLSCYRIPT